MVLHRLGLRAVPGDVGLDVLGAQVHACAHLAQFVEGGVLSGDYDRGGPVEDGHADPSGPGVQEGFDLVDGCEHRHQAAQSAEFEHRPAAQRHQPGRLLQRERARHMGGGDLALRVADDRTRFDAEGPP